MTLGEALLEPTRIYVKPLLALHRAGLLKAAAHITGGGPARQPAPRAARGRGRRGGGGQLAVPPVFPWLARTGQVAEDEMLRVFNCGLGMVLWWDGRCRPGHPALQAGGVSAHRIGRMETASGGATVRMRGHLAL
jgi:phosphoribosylformylglycinamidine cyclo-ligase